MRKHGETIGKYAVGAGLVLADEICPTFGEYMTNSTHLVGAATELTGNLSGNKEVKRIGRVLNSGSQIGSSINGLIGGNGDGEEEHIKNCLKCSSESFKEMTKVIGVAAEVTEGIKDAAKIIMEVKKPFF